jgi:hypothetical protein
MSSKRGLFKIKTGHRFEECLKGGKVQLTKLREISKPRVAS